MTKASDRPDREDLTGREVLVSVCGGIAAYKVCEVVSAIVQRGAGVTVAMTKAARKFVGVPTFQALSGRRVLTSIWHGDASDVEHIALSGAADVILVAPATANMIGKIAGGIADDVVSTLVLSADAPVLLAPAMNDRMWKSPAVQHNVETLKARGLASVGPREGWLACRSVGMGRMAEPAEIVKTLIAMFNQQPQGDQPGKS